MLNEITKVKRIEIVDRPHLYDIVLARNRMLIAWI